MPTVHFYTIAGGMVGLDLHTYFTIAPPVVPVPVPFQPHVVAEKFTSLTSKFWRWTPTVTNMDLPMLQGSWSLYLVPHVPIPIPPPHPAAELAELAINILNSGSSPFMTSSSVTTCGGAASMCVYMLFGVQINCWAPVPVPVNNLVISYNSVITNATLGDYAAAILAAAINAAVSYGLGKLGGKFSSKFYAKTVAGAVGRRIALGLAKSAVPLIVSAVQALLDAVNRATGSPVQDPVAWATGKASGAAQKAVDG